MLSSTSLILSSVLVVTGSRSLRRDLESTYRQPTTLEIWGCGESSKQTKGKCDAGEQSIPFPASEKNGRVRVCDKRLGGWGHRC